MICYRICKHSLSHIIAGTVSVHYSIIGSSDSLLPNTQVFEIVQRAVHFNPGNKGVDKKPSIAALQKKLLREK